MPKIWDQFDFRIASHYLPALINADETGLDDGESRDLAEFQRVARGAARAGGWTVGHWSSEPDDAGDDWGTCDVSGGFAGRVRVSLMVYREGDAA